MKRAAAIALATTLLLSACSDEDNRNSSGYETNTDADRPVCSNLFDESTQKEVAERLVSAGLSEDTVHNFLQWVDDYNGMVESDHLPDGFQSIDNAYPDQDLALSAKTWMRKHPDNEDLLCFTVAFYLLNKDISLDPLRSPGKLYPNPYIEWDDETQNRYYSLFRPVKIEADFSVEQRAGAISEEWDAMQVTFTNEMVSLITVWKENTIDGSPYVSPVHAGVLVNGGDDLLWIEKTNPLFPYQAILFKNKDQVEDYLIDRIESYGQDMGIIFVMENSALLS